MQTTDLDDEKKLLKEILESVEKLVPVVGPDVVESFTDIQAQLQQLNEDLENKSNEHTLVATWEYEDFEGKTNAFDEREKLVEELVNIIDEYTTYDEKSDLHYRIAPINKDTDWYDSVGFNTMINRREK